MSTIELFIGLMSFGTEYTGYDGERHPVTLEVYQSADGDQTARKYIEIEFDILEPEPMTIDSWFIASTGGHWDETIFKRENLRIQDQFRVWFGDTVKLKIYIDIRLPEELRVDFG